MQATSFTCRCAIKIICVKVHPLGRGYVQAFNLKPEHKRGSKNERYCRNHRKSGKNEIYICESKGYI